ncbi:ribose 5-phosphate isomerase [Cytobacillus firmus]|uniref:ribose-5-phosphate isomerase RpiA n=1 Tax=Cytobacillus firmus TaxID=1399 RepID=UPI00064E40A6|nr:ribose-5-phosphate isomerase RpiA [Cytobacillus firmus]KML41923.1 ribose 5-phosphate isomerase [Cytobacillus firmus]MBG9448040.1 ribose 5-phosphate isomerase [Cytobacillus firmus]URT71301.1 ribose-5-phosphate isomerase RpiA [Cytobacillus firmus]WHY62212.1 ribose-5-phosphate isomerase RpiA [Cytobacillus firmus]
MNFKDLQKKAAGEKAADFVEDGMIIGLGSGSTVYWFLKRLGELVNAGLTVKGVPSSLRTEGWAREFNIPLADFSETQILDLAIDGADEVDPEFNLTKGGGGSLLREKIVDANAKKLIIIVDESKLVQQLGKFPLPVEIVPFGWELTTKRITELGAIPQLRVNDGEVFVSNNGNYILDCQFERIPNPKELHKQLKQITGVVETGLFIEMTDLVLVGRTDKVEALNRME